MNYQTAYNKIIDAYFRDEIRPYCAEFCFCGTLANGSNWYRDETLYSLLDYKNMEWALIHSITSYKGNYENALFSGMSAALDVLKEIHISRGEIIDEEKIFTKRKSKTSNNYHDLKALTK